ncbi:hypothetical protein CCP3SC1_150004 [Gammaproteobacteria bacterium]
MKDRVFTLQTVKGLAVGDAPPFFGIWGLGGIEISNQPKLPVLLGGKNGRGVCRPPGGGVVGGGGISGVSSPNQN